MPTPGLSREAHRHLEQAVEGAPDNPEFHLDFCVALGDLGRVDDSIGLYRTALALAPGTPAALANLGFALRDRGDYTEGDATSPFIPRLLPFSH